MMADKPGTRTVTWHTPEQKRIAELEVERDKLREQYNDLIMQVQQKHPDETRHETAKRIIHQHENQNNPPESALLEEK